MVYILKISTHKLVSSNFTKILVITVSILVLGLQMGFLALSLECSRRGRARPKAQILLGIITDFKITLP